MVSIRALLVEQRSLRIETTNTLLDQQEKMPFPHVGETKELNDETRRDAGGSFIRLPHGITHYELGNDSPLHQGEGAGVRDVALVHGFSVPYFIYDPTFGFLVRTGFRVLRYDLFGRGFSDRPRVRYNLDLFVNQLADLLDALRFTQPVNLMGLSMGGPITAAFAARHPERVSKLILIDPAGARPISLSPILKAAKIPLLAEAILGLVGTESMVRSAASDFFDPKLIREFQARYMMQMKYKGFKRAILSTIRNDMLGSFIEIYKRVGEIRKPVLLFWGRNDTTVPIAHSDDLLAAMPQAGLRVIENCGHIPHYEKPEEVNPILLEFIQ